MSDVLKCEKHDHHSHHDRLHNWHHNCHHDITLTTVIIIIIPIAIMIAITTDIISTDIITIAIISTVDITTIMLTTITIIIINLSKYIIAWLFISCSPCVGTIFGWNINLKTYLLIRLFFFLGEYYLTGLCNLHFLINIHANLPRINQLWFLLNCLVNRQRLTKQNIINPTTNNKWNRTRNNIFYF